MKAYIDFKSSKVFLKLFGCMLNTHSFTCPYKKKPMGVRSEGCADLQYCNTRPLLEIVLLTPVFDNIQYFGLDILCPFF